MKHSIFLTVLFSLNAINHSLAKPTPDQLQFFESKIRPVLIQKCYRCHSEEAQQKGRLKGGLLLDTRAGIRKGGDTGPAVIPNDVKGSLLIAALKHEKKLEMPPSGKLDEQLINDFVKWVSTGAADPRDGQTIVKRRTIDIEEGRKHWAFQPLVTVKDKHTVDDFIQSKLKAKGITANPLAGKRTLIRRVYYDLIGLPPTPEEVKAFIDDNSPTAYASMIDRLLANPHYGERWARHWLDLARFAESNGYAFDKDRKFAYHFRDFVIRALNDDMPYDQFVRQQIAGDLLNPGNQSAHSATGFLMAGPFTTQQTAKERERSRYEQLDDMIATVGTSMLGLTIGCARCHDHKYDPLPQNDYYQLIAGLAEVGFADVGIPIDPEGDAKAKAEHAKKVAELQAKLTAFETSVLTPKFETWLKTKPEIPAAPKIQVWHHIGPFVGSNMNEVFKQAFPPEHEIDLKKTYQNGKLKWAKRPRWKDGAVHNTLKGENAANYLYRVIDSSSPQTLKLSLGSDDAIKVWVNGKEVLANLVGRGAAADQEKVTITLNKGRNELLMKIVNGGGPSGFYFKVTETGAPANVAAILKKPTQSWSAKERTTVLKWFGSRDAQWQKHDQAVKELQKKAPKPNEIKVFSAKKRGSTYNFGKDTYKVYHLSRGNVNNKTQPAKPGFLQVLTRINKSEQQQGKDAASRIALAHWLTDTKQGAGHLLARVIVNRLWHHHFGRGIVATPSDFGTRGERPTHPDLLDWLAKQLIDSGWKLKTIHRLILNSHAYKQSGQPNAEGQKHDPDNMLLWRKSSQRLEAEIIRDALLTVSGSLDKKMFGAGTLNGQSNRRSIYLTVKRSRLIPILQLFDAPDTMQGVGKRETTTVAPQALAMMNSSFVRQLATKLAKRVKPDAKTSLEQGIVNAYLVTLSRPPSESEKQTVTTFIQQQTKMRGDNNQANDLAFADFCHLLLCMNEMIYID